MTADYLQRFGLTHDIFPQNAQGRTFFEAKGYARLKRRFDMLGRQPGVGVLTGEVGVGKTSAIRNLCAGLPRPDFRVVYLCDTAISPVELYRQLAVELGIRPSHRRGQVWHDLKAAMTHMVDDEGSQPVLVLDEAQHLSDRFLTDLSGFLNFAMDSRNLLVLWLVGQPPLLGLLRMKCHAALASRISSRIQLEPLSTREEFLAFLAHGLQAAGATSKLLSDSASELLFRVSRGMPREAFRLLREALILTHEQGRALVDDTVLEAVLDEEQP
jgi:type II secretory pathway predicted ATPase ExeA